MNNPQHTGLIAWFIQNPVASNLLMLLIMLSGLIGISTIEKEVFPRFTPNQVRIETRYPGAGTLEVEEAVCIPIEEAIHDISGIKHLHSEISGSECEIKAEIFPDHNREQVMAMIQSRIQSLSRLPRQLEKIEVLQDTRDSDDGVIWVALYGNTDPFELQSYGEQIQQKLSAIPGVRQARNYGRRNYEIGIDVQPEKLLQYHLTLDDVAQAVRAVSVDLPGGLIHNPQGEMVLRVNQRARNAEAMRALIIKTLPDGNRLQLGQIATIRDRLEERTWDWRHNGQTAQGWEVHTYQDSVDVARQVKAQIAEWRQQLPPGLHLITWWDDSQAYEERIDSLLEDGLSGFVLVCLVLSLFLRIRIALWAGIGIFTSVLGAFWVMPLLDISLNMLSLFGFLLAMGILVDDAIIIGESIHSYQESQKYSPLDATIAGVKDVALPVILSVLVVLVAFLPGMFLPGWGGQMMQPICIVMILTLLFSLIEALLILPSHLHGSDTSHLNAPDQLQTLRNKLNRKLDNWVAHYYLPLLKKALEWRYLTLALFTGLILFCTSLVLTERVKHAVSPDVTKDSFWVSMKMPQTAPYSEMQNFAAKVEHALLDLRDHLNQGQSPSVINGVETFVWEHGGGIWLEFSAEGRKKLNVERFIQDWRERIGDIGQGKLDFIYKEGDVPYDIEILLANRDPNILTQGVEHIKTYLQAIPGVYDVIDSTEAGKPEIQLKLKPNAERLGLKLEELAEQVRHGYYGDEVHRFLRGANEVRVMVRYPLQERQSLQKLRQHPIRLPSGSLVPVDDLAEINLVPGYSMLFREDRQRVLKVQARVNPTLADSNAIYTQLQEQEFPKIQRLIPNLSLQIGQEREEQQQILLEFARNSGLAIALIYALIAVPFRSYSKPLIFLLAAPVAWCGAILAHWGLSMPLSMESLVGMIAASGVVVNDSLVLLDYMRKQDRSNEPTESLIIKACVSRFRAILLAFMTNFAGFLPTLLETSPQAQFLVPMTLSLSAGLLIGMLASLIFTPVMYATINTSRPTLNAIH